MEVHDIVQETGIKTIRKKKKCKKAKRLSEEALQIAVKRREVKNKGERESHVQLNAEFQRIERRDKKTLFNECKNIGASQKGKDQRSLHENWKYQGNISPKNGHKKDRNGRDLVDAEETMKRQNTWKNCTKKKNLNELDNYNGVICHPEPDILECEVKQALESTAVNKASG